MLQIVKIVVFFIFMHVCAYECGFFLAIVPLSWYLTYYLVLCFLSYLFCSCNIIGNPHFDMVLNNLLRFTHLLRYYFLTQINDCCAKDAFWFFFWQILLGIIVLSPLILYVVLLGLHTKVLLILYDFSCFWMHIEDVKIRKVIFGELKKSFACENTLFCRRMTVLSSRFLLFRLHSSPLGSY